MNGYTYGDNPPTEACPYCNTLCEADFVDIGVGFTQCDPYHCPSCGASEIGPHDAPRELSADEQRTGWYGPGEEPSDKANVIGGSIVSHNLMRDTYRREFVGNPLYHEPGYVEDWFAETRKGRV